MSQDATETTERADTATAPVEPRQMRLMYGLGAFATAVVVMFLLSEIKPEAWLPSTGLADQMSAWSQGRRLETLFILAACLVGVVVLAVVLWSASKLGTPGATARPAVAAMVLGLVVIGALCHFGTTSGLGEQRVIERAEAKYGVTIDTDPGNAPAFGPRVWSVDGTLRNCDHKAFYADTSDPVLKCAASVESERSELPVGGER